MPHAERTDTALWRRWQFWVPLSLVVVAALIAVALPLWQKREFAVDYDRITEQARSQAAASDALRQQLDQATGDYNFALGKKYAFPSTVQLIDDVTKLLPDDTWLTQLEIKTITKGKETHREMLLRGESGNAGRLISALEDSKLFEQAAPRSPTTKIQPGPGEVFDLGTQVVPSAAPQLVAVAGVNTPRVSPRESGAATAAAATALGAKTAASSGPASASTSGPASASTAGPASASTAGPASAPTAGPASASTAGPASAPAAVPSASTPESAGSSAPRAATTTPPRLAPGANAPPNPGAAGAAIPLPPGPEPRVINSSGGRKP